MNIYDVQLRYDQLVKFNNNNDGRERCGLILADRDNRLCVVEVPNAADGPDRFSITKTETMRVMKLLPFMDLIGFLHTHMDTPVHPGPDDIAAMKLLPPGMFGVVYCLPTRTLVYYDDQGGKRMQVFRRERTNDGDVAKPQGRCSGRVAVLERVGDDGGW